MLENILEILPQGIFFRRRKQTTERLSFAFIYLFFVLQRLPALSP
jgi:hypothetical protein